MAPALEEFDTTLGELQHSSWFVATDAQLRVLQLSGDRLFRNDRRPDRWIGHRLKEVMPARTWSRIGPHFLAAAAGEHQSFEYWTRDRKHVYWIQIVPVEKESAVTSLVAVAFDITERLRADAELRLLGGRLSESEHISDVGSWELDLDTRQITCSPRFARLLGLKRRAQPLAFEEFEARVHVEDRAGVRRAIEQALSEGSATCEYRALLPGGSVRTLTVRGEAVRGTDGRPLFLRGATLDVTEQRESERERSAALALFAQGFDAAPIGMALADPDTGRYMRVNDAQCALLGRPREDLLAMTIDEVTHREDRGPLGDLRQTMLSGATVEHHSEKRYLRPDGSVLWAALHVAPVRRADGTVEVLFAQTIDITERKQREAQLYRYVSDARGSDASVMPSTRIGCSSTGSRSSTCAPGRQSSARCS